MNSRPARDTYEIVSIIKKEIVRNKTIAGRVKFLGF